jgi:cysteine synthase
MQFSFFLYLLLIPVHKKMNLRYLNIVVPGRIFNIPNLLPSRRMSSRIHTAKNAGEKKPFPAAPTAANSTIHESILDTIGNTPVIKINNLCEDAPGVNVYAKLEAFNPMGSVKDRLAVGVLEWAERHGQIRPGQTVIEASSGNTGIGLAMTCAVKGYPFVCVMAESFSVERRKLMRFLGAKVVLTNPAHKGSGMIIKANELAEKHGYFLTHQFENEANAWIHKHTTGQEILQAFTQQGRQLDHVFLGYGTGGTLLGVGQALKEGSPETLVHACEPSNAPMLFSGMYVCDVGGLVHSLITMMPCSYMYSIYTSCFMIVRCLRYGCLPFV